MSRYIPEHPKKGSTEAYVWAEKMRAAREKKARTKARVREAGQLAEMQFFGPGGSLEVTPETMRHNLYRVCAWCKKSLGKVAPYTDRRPTHGICRACLAKEMKAFPKKNPGARYHDAAAKVAGRYRKDGTSPTERSLYAGMEIAHKDSAKSARSMKMNPIAVYNPPAPKVVGTIYNTAIEIRAKKTGSDLAGKYKHVFGKNVKILGLDNGDVVIHHTGGKRLWISRKDYERSGGQHE